MDDTNNTDVNIEQPDTQTGDGSSAVEETSSVSDTGENVSTQAEEQKTVPYDRFKQVNDEFRQTSQTVQQLQQELQMIKMQQQLAQQSYQQPQAPVNQEEVQQKQAIKQQLQPFIDEIAKENGWVSRKEIEAQEQEKRVNAEITTMSSKYTGKDGKPAFDEKAVIKHAIDNGFNNLEKAYKDMHESELINWHVQQAIQKSKGIVTESSNSTGSQQVGVTDDDLLKAASAGDEKAQLAYNKRILQGMRKS